MKTAISWTFLAYFVILIVERLQSLFRVAADGNGFFSSGFSGYVNTLTALSLIATAILLTVFNREFLHSLIHPDASVNMTMLCLTAGVLLLSGMVHTGHTISWLQFIAYGVLIVGLILQTILSVKAGSPAFSTWYSLIYLVAFSMAIPVMYHSSITHAALFHVLEAVSAVVLVVMFTFLMTHVMTGQGSNLLHWVPFLAMVVLDTVLIVMRWQGSPNWFVLIFASLSTVLFVVGKILFSVLSRKA